MENRERLKALLLERSLFVGEFTLSSGASSTYYVDARRTTLSAASTSLAVTKQFTRLGWTVRESL